MTIDFDSFLASITTTSVSSITTERTVTIFHVLKYSNINLSFCLKIPTRPTFVTVTTVTTTSTSSITTTTTSITTASTTISQTTYRLPISGIIGITLACLLISALLTWIICSFIHVTLIRFLLLKSGLRQQLVGIHSIPTSDLQYNQTENNNLQSIRQYKLATRYRQQRAAGKYAVFTNKTSLRKNLVVTQT